MNYTVDLSVYVSENELIRCKDCKYCEAYYHGEDRFTYFCTQYLSHVKADDYCSFAERKEGK